MGQHNYVGMKVLNMEDAHVTIFYLGTENLDLETSKELEAWHDTRIVVPRIGVGMFGPENTVPVVLIPKHPMLTAIRGQINLRQETQSEFKEFNPHISLPDGEWVVPKKIALGDLYFSYGSGESYRTYF